MFWLNSADLVIVIGAVGSCGIACIYAFCSSMRLSRCRKIRCLCFSCDRDLETAEEIAMELEHQQAAPSAAV